MPGQPMSIQGVLRKLLGGAAYNIDGYQDQPARQGDRYGDLGSIPFLTPQQAGAVEGSYFTWAQEGTRNTGVNISVAAGTTYATTQCSALIHNNNQQGKDVILDYLDLKYDAVNTAGVAGFLYLAIDDGNRYSSSGNLTTGYNADGEQPSGVIVYLGSTVATAATGQARDLGHVVYLNGVGVATPILNIRLKFGGIEAAGSSVAIPATAGVHACFMCPPVVIRPGKSFVLNEFQTSRSAAGTGEFFLGAWVR